MKTNRMLVSKSTSKGAGTKSNLLATGVNLKSITEVHDEVL